MNCIFSVIITLFLLFILWILFKLSSKRPHKQLKKTHKILILGSAPYMKSWVKDHLQWFEKNNYHIVTFNNSWKLVPDISKIVWHCSNDHSIAGTYVPSNKEKTKFLKYIIHNDTDKSNVLYKRFVTTMFLNIIYHYIYNHIIEKKHHLHIVVIGCDMIYKKEKDTFYSDIPGNKAANDPIIRLGDERLNDELVHSLKLCKSNQIDIYNASEHESRLPYPRFRNHLT